MKKVLVKKNPDTKGKNRLRSLLGIVLGILIVVGVLTGCGKGTEGQTAGKDGDVASTQGEIKKSPPHFNRLVLGDTEDLIIARNGDYNGKKKSKNGSSVITYTGLGATKKIDEATNTEILIDEGIDVKFYLDSPEAKRTEKLAGIYKIEVTKGDDEILWYYNLTPDATLEEIVNGAGKAFATVVDGTSPTLQTLYYQILDVEGQPEANHYVYFVIDQGIMVEHGMIAKYDLK